jgi:hypothetical protein
MIKMRTLRVRLKESDDGIDPLNGLKAEVGPIGRYLKEDGGLHFVVVPRHISGFRYGEVMRTIRFYADDPNEFEKFGRRILEHLKGIGYDGGIPESLESGDYDFLVGDNSLDDVMNVLRVYGKAEVLGE